MLVLSASHLERLHNEEKTFGMTLPRRAVLENLNRVFHRYSVQIVLMQRAKLVAQDDQRCRKQKVPGSRLDAVAELLTMGRGAYTRNEFWAV